MSNILTIVASVLASIMSIAGNPALTGAVGAGAQQLIPLLGLLAALALEGEAAHDKLQALDDELKAIVAAGRPPTADEWSAWDVRHQTAKAKIAAA